MSAMAAALAESERSSVVEHRLDTLKQKGEQLLLETPHRFTPTVLSMLYKAVIRTGTRRSCAIEQEHVHAGQVLRAPARGAAELHDGWAVD